jgi:hypothetical protein
MNRLKSRRLRQGIFVAVSLGVIVALTVLALQGLLG